MTWQLSTLPTRMHLSLMYFLATSSTRIRYILATITMDTTKIKDQSCTTDPTGAKCKHLVAITTLMSMVCLHCHSHRIFAREEPKNVYFRESSRQCVGYSTLDDADPEKVYRFWWQPLDCEVTRAPFVCRYNPGITCALSLENLLDILLLSSRLYGIP